MRDYLATLLQTSFVARDCGESLEQCMLCWQPLLVLVATKLGQSPSELLSASLVRYLHSMHDFEISVSELKQLELPSKNDEMGDSIIEKSLDDHSLSHCFGFLGAKDICEGIERTSHRFLQVSRHRKYPFIQNYLEWKTENEDGEYEDDSERKETPLERLLNATPPVPKAIALRALSRFKVIRLGFDPALATVKERTYHSMDFRDVLPVLAKGIESCSLSNRTFWATDCFFPSELSHVTEFEIHSPVSEQLAGFCDVFAHCRKLEISYAGFGSPKDFEPLNTLNELESLILQDIEFESMGMDDFCLDPRCLSNLTTLKIQSTLLPYFAPMLTPKMSSLNVTFNHDAFVTSLWSGKLSDLKCLCLQSLCDRSQSQLMKRHLELPLRIPCLKVYTKNWATLADWVPLVDELVCYIIRDSSCVIPMLECELKNDIINRWSVKRCFVRVTNPRIQDVQILSELVTRHHRSTYFEIGLDQFVRGIPGLEAQISQLTSLMMSEHNCCISAAQE